MREHLRALSDAGLDSDEAFLVAAKRIGALTQAVAALTADHAGDAAELPNEQATPEGASIAEARADEQPATPQGETVAAEHPGTPTAALEDAAGGAERADATDGIAAGLWRSDRSGGGAGRAAAKREFVVMGALACGAAAAVKAPEILGVHLEDDGEFYARNVSLLVLPFLAGYFGWKRRLGAPTLALLAGGFVAAAGFVNAYPFDGGRDLADTEILAALHLPIAMWLVVGVAHAAGDWRSHDKRIEFVRFTGEWAIHYGLIALGGGIFAGLTAGLFAAIDLDAGEFVGLWLLPCGAAGAVVVAAWLAESRQGVLERIAPVLTRLFTPMFAALLVAFLAAMALTGRGIDVSRGVLISFDLLLALILGLVIYSIAARDPQAPPGIFDILLTVLVVAALLVDLLVLGAVAGRLSDFGTTPNRIAAMGENLVLLANLGWTAWLCVGFLRGRRPFSALERWQAAYAPVYVLWLGAVVVAFPPIFGFA